MQSLADESPSVSWDLLAEIFRSMFLRSSFVSSYSYIWTLNSCCCAMKACAFIIVIGFLMSVLFQVVGESPACCVWFFQYSYARNHCGVCANYICLSLPSLPFQVCLLYLKY